MTSTRPARLAACIRRRCEVDTNISPAGFGRRRALRSTGVRGDEVLEGSITAAEAREERVSFLHLQETRKKEEYPQRTQQNPRGTPKKLVFFPHRTVDPPS